MDLSRLIFFLLTCFFLIYCFICPNTFLKNSDRAATLKWHYPSSKNVKEDSEDVNLREVN